MVNVLCLIWKNLHRAEKIYTGSARGARDKYEVCSLMNYVILWLHLYSLHRRNMYRTRDVKYIWGDLWWRDFFVFRLSLFSTLRADLEDYFECMT